MSLRGLKKTLYRTPHQLFGRKDSDDLRVKQWEHDISNALAGLEYMKSNKQSWCKYWIDNATYFTEIIETFRDLHCSLENDIEEENVIKRRKERAKLRKKKNESLVNEELIPDGDEELSKLTMHELNKAFQLSKRLRAEIERLCQTDTNLFVEQCNGMIVALKATEKLLVKRNHKKIDFDMQFKKVETLHKHSIVENATDKDKSSYDIHSKKLNEQEATFNDIHEKVNIIVPQVLENLSEFLNKLSIKLYLSNQELTNVIQKNLTKFVVTQGLSSLKELDYEQIIGEFQVAHSRSMEKLDSFMLLKEYRSLRQKNLTQKTVSHVNNVAGTVVDSTVNLTSTIYTKTTKPNQKVSLSLTNAPAIHNPIKPMDKNGFFASAADPLKFIKQSIIAKDLINTPDGNLTLSSFSSHEEVNVVNTTKSALKYQDDTYWMKPLHSLKATNTFENSPDTSKTPDSPNPQTPDSASFNLPPPKHPSIGSPSVISSAPSLSQKSETYKFMNVAMKKIRGQILKDITSPNIDHCPIPLPLNKFEVDESICEYVKARSNISAQTLI